MLEIANGLSLQYLMTGGLSVNGWLAFIVCEVGGLCLYTALRWLYRLCVVKRARYCPSTEEKASLQPLSICQDASTAEPEPIAKKDLLRYLNTGADHTIRNIAVTGPYGAGKSTFIERILADYTKRAVTLSLAKFTGADDPDSLEQVKYSLVQQLVYSEKPDQLLSSKISRLMPLNQKAAAKAACRVLMFILAISVLAGWDKKIPLLAGIYPHFSAGWKASFPVSILAATLASLSMILVLNTSYHLIYRLIIQIQGFRLEKVTTKYLQMGKAEDHSLVNYYAEELLNFFCVTETQLVVIEDLDRFTAKDSIQLFTELRDLNALINQFPLIHHPVFFIYAVKDSLFAPHERTKFFELIIPIVPIVNNTMTQARLIRRLKDRGLQIVRGDDEPNNINKGWLSHNLVRTCASYLHDMRMLENIVNEFVVYHNTHSHLTNGGGDYGKLFSLIMIKNLLPEAFEQLIRNEGPVYGFIQETRKTISQNITLYQNEVTQQIQNKQEMQKYDHSAVAGAVICKALKGAGLGEVIEIDGHSIISCMNNEQAFQTLLEKSRRNERFTFRTSNQRSGSHHIPFDQAFKKYGKSLQQFADARHADLDYLIQKRNELQAQCERLKHASLASGSTEKVWKAVRQRYPSRVSSDEDAYRLVATLINHEYLDENYRYYTSVYQEGALTAEEVTFCHNLQGRLLRQREFSLDRPDRILEELHPRSLAEGWGLHPSFIAYFYELDELKGDNQRKLGDYNAQAFLEAMFSASLDDLDDYFLSLDMNTLSQGRRQFMILLYRWSPALLLEFYRGKHHFPIQEFFLYLAIDERPLNGDIIQQHPAVEQLLNEYKKVPSIGFSGQIEKYSIPLSDFFKQLHLLNFKFENLHTDIYNPEEAKWLLENDLYALSSPLLNALFCSLDESDGAVSIGRTKAIVDQHAVGGALLESRFDELVSCCIHQDQEWRESPEETANLINQYADQSNVKPVKDEESEGISLVGILTKLSSRVALFSDIENKSIWPLLIKHDAVEFSMANLDAYWKGMETTEPDALFPDEFESWLAPPTRKSIPEDQKINITGNLLVRLADMNRKWQPETIDWVLSNTRYPETVIEPLSADQNRAERILCNPNFKYPLAALNNVFQKWPNLIGRFIEAHQHSIPADTLPDELDAAVIIQLLTSLDIAGLKVKLFSLLDLGKLSGSENWINDLIKSVMSIPENSNISIEFSLTEQMMSSASLSARLAMIKRLDSNCIPQNRDILLQGISDSEDLRWLKEAKNDYQLKKPNDPDTRQAVELLELSGCIKVQDEKRKTIIHFLDVESDS